MRRHYIFLSPHLFEEQEIDQRAVDEEIKQVQPLKKIRLDRKDAPTMPTRMIAGIAPFSLLSHATYAISGDSRANTVQPRI